MTDELSGDTYEYLRHRITVLSDRVWSSRVRWPDIKLWLKNFNGEVSDVNAEHMSALFLLSQFMFFGRKEIDVLLTSLYRDHIICGIIDSIIERDGRQKSKEDLEDKVNNSLSETRFVGVGGASESGHYILYRFRQMNRIPAANFMDPSAIFNGTRKLGSSVVFNLANQKIRKYIFIDDICGSGETAINTYDETAKSIVKSDPGVEVVFACIFGTSSGLARVAREAKYSKVICVNELDDSYKVLNGKSRYFHDLPDGLDAELIKNILRSYGKKVQPMAPLGFDEGQLLLGLDHNTPDNTLPIFWCDETHGLTIPWASIFKRYAKK